MLNLLKGERHTTHAFRTKRKARFKTNRAFIDSVKQVQRIGRIRFRWLVQLVHQAQLVSIEQTIEREESERRHVREHRVVLDECDQRLEEPGLRASEKIVLHQASDGQDLFYGVMWD